MELHITCIPGDGIGPEIVRETKKVLDKVAHKYGHKMIYKDILMGGASIDVHGVPLTEEAIADAKAADAVLMGSIGGNTTTSPWYKLPPEKRPEAGLLAMRKALNLFANLRPAVLYDELAAACPLKEEISKAGFDMLIMRELTGGLYFGERRTIEENGVRVSENVEKITIPHFKKVYRLYGRDTGKAIADYITVHDETVDDTKGLTIFDPMATWKRKGVYNFEARQLLVPIFKDGKRVYDSPSLEEIKAYCAQQVDTLWDEVKRFDYPHKYYVDLSDKLWDIQQCLLRTSQM